jgi:hypothetical protein
VLTNTLDPICQSHTPARLNAVCPLSSALAA